MKTLPIHFDLFALVILLGVAQGLFLGVFFLTGDRGKRVANRCLGFFTLAISAISAEIFLNYTNYTFRLLWLGDFAEPFNFVLGPLFYFFVFSRLWQRLPRHWFWHMLPFAIWLANSITWFYQPIEFKYNSYVYSQHPELSFVDAQHYLNEDFTGLRKYINEMTMLSCVVYAVLALLTIRMRSRQQVVLQKWAGLRTLQLLCWLFALVPILILVIKPQFYHDVGDYLLATYIAITLYTMSFLVMRGSSFLGDEPQTEPQLLASEGDAEPRKKYEKSSLSEEVEEAILQKLTRLMDEKKPYLQSDLSLSKLAGLLNTSPHHLSQLLNDRLDQNFFDLLAMHRVREAQQLLNDPATTHLKIDEIAEQVGYNSTSAFHTAFKRLTNQTPAQFRDQSTGSNPSSTSSRPA